MALLVSAADREATSEEHLENLADQLIGVRESLAGELAAAREGLARARREREASDRARDQALEAARVAEEGREAAEAALAERSRREEGGRRSLECRMLDSVGEAVIATDLDGRTVFWNRAAEGLYGWSREEAIGRELGDTTPAVASKAQAVRAMDAIARGESWSGTIRVRRKDGSFVPVTLTGTPVFDGDGVHTGLIIVSSAASRAGGHESGVHDATATRARASESAVPSGLKSDQAEGEVSEGDPEPRAAETKTIGSAILVVEDDDSARELASRALREAGHDVFEAQDGVEALRIWEDERDHIGLVLTDVVMPRMSGRALVDRLRAQRPNLPALFMSAYAEDAVTLHGLVERDDPVLGKPLDRDALSTRVRELLERAALRSAS
jgi:PAS domain S-box-containing protein